MEVGAFSSEGCFTINEYADTGGSVWSAVDATGHRVASVPYGDQFTFTDGIAEVRVVDVSAPVFVGHDCRIYADIPVIDARHRAVGRSVTATDAGPH